MKFFKNVFWFIWSAQLVLTFLSLGCYGAAIVMLPFELAREFGLEAIGFISVISLLALNLIAGFIIEIRNENKLSMSN